MFVLFVENNAENINMKSLAYPICLLLGHPYNDFVIKVRGPFVETFCIEKDSYMEAI